MAHLLSEGQTTCLVGLPRADTALAGVPIEIVSAEGDHCLSAQTKPRQEEEHRAMAPTGGRVTLVDREDSLDVLLASGGVEGKRVATVGESAPLRLNRA